MRMFLTKIALFVLLFCTTNALCVSVLKRFVAPFAENGIYAAKYSFYEKQASEYNLIFFGSSRTFRQINPKIIDDRLADARIRSFNLGAPATFNPEALFLFENYLQNRSSNSPTQLAFVELTELTPIADGNRLFPRSYYYLNSSYLRFVLDYYYSDRGYSVTTKLKASRGYLVAYVLNAIVLPNLTHARAADFNLGENSDGYLALDEQLKSWGTRELLARKNALVKDTLALTRRLNNSERTRPTPIANSAYLNFLTDLIAKAERKNTRLYFIVPPRLEDYRRIAYLRMTTIGNRIISIPVDKHPELNLVENSFDIAHYNSSGATIYSELVAMEIRRMVASVRPKP